MARAAHHAAIPSRPRLRRNAKLVAGGLALALIGIVAAAFAPTGGGNVPVGVHDVAPRQHYLDALGTRTRHVFDSSISASLYGREVVALEDQGRNLQGQLVSDLPPVAPRAFIAPEDAYRRFAEGWSRTTAARVAVLGAALRRSSRASAERAWAAAWSAYLHLGAVYGLIGKRDREIDGVPGVVGSDPARFTGFHRIEMGLWGGAPPASLEPSARLLARDVAGLPQAIATATITPLDYATRAHEILEDAQRDLMSGMDVPWSGAGVLGTAAGIAATREVIATLSPLLEGRDSALSASEAQLAMLSSAFTQVRAEHGGRWPTLDALTLSQRELLDGRLAGALSALEQIPGVLETGTIKAFPKLR